jgi:hypothetical protein
LPAFLVEDPSARVGVAVGVAISALPVFRSVLPLTWICA